MLACHLLGETLLRQEGWIESEILHRSILSSCSSWDAACRDSFGCDGDGYDDDNCDDDDDDTMYGVD